jgi:hypothetical protein
MRSVAAGALYFQGLRPERAPHNLEMREGTAPRALRGAAGRSARPDELVLAVVALDQGRVDRAGEGEIVEFE